MFAAALVIAMTGTASPTWRLRAEIDSPTSDSTRITSARGWSSTAIPSPTLPLSALIVTSDAPQVRPAADGEQRSGTRRPVRPDAAAAIRPSAAPPPT